MIRLLPACTLAAACAFTVTAAAQQSSVTSRTKVDADDAKVMKIVGCLAKAPAGDAFVLSGVKTAEGEDLNAKSRTDVDVDDDRTEVRTRTQRDADDEAVGTSGKVTSYVVTPQPGVDLSSHVGSKVEVMAVAIDAKEDDEDDNARVETETETKTRVEGAPDSRTKSRTETELPRGDQPRVTVMSVKQVAATCTM